MSQKTTAQVIAHFVRDKDCAARLRSAFVEHLREGLQVGLSSAIRINYVSVQTRGQQFIVTVSFKRGVRTFRVGLKQPVADILRNQQGQVVLLLEHLRVAIYEAGTQA